MKILCIGDIFGKTGRRAIKEQLMKLRNDLEIDLVIANAENATHCRGLNQKHYKELMESGIDFFTMGNHVWKCPEIFEILKTKRNIIRPYNINVDLLPIDGASESLGTTVIKIKDISIRITNLLGDSVPFNNMQSSPFKAMLEIKNKYESTDFHIVDFHAESTSEKNALFHYFKNDITLLFGTHTHVQTADEKIRDGTAYITDVGMSGPSEGIIGAKLENMKDKFFKNTGFYLEEETGKYQFSAIYVELDEITKTATKIERILIYEE